MNRKKRIISALLASAILITGACGCNSDTPPTETETTPVSTETVTETTPPVTSADSIKQPDGLMLLSERFRSENSKITDITPLKTTGKCVDTESAFHIETESDFSGEQLEKLLSITPAVEFSVTEENEGYNLTFKEELPDGAIIRFEEKDEKGDTANSWAFQTEEDFKIKSVYPADKSDYVYSDTGIEITFSTPVSAENVNSYFEINPPVDGKFLTHRNILYFVPYNELSSYTSYTVTVKSGIASTESGTLQEDYTFSFRTSQNRRGDYFYINGRSSETYLEGDPAVIEIVCSDSLKNKNFDVKLYSFASADEYLDTMKKAEESQFGFGNYTVDVSGLTEIFSSSEPPKPNLVEWRPMFITLPDNLTEGYYIADIIAGEINHQVFIQVNPISVFYLSLGEENSFFINDTKTGSAASGAEVSLTIGGKTYRGKTDSEGLVNIETEPCEDYCGILEIKYNNSRFIDVYYASQVEEATYYDLYYMYMYTDREAYLTTDTVKVWGVILPRRSGTAIPEKLSLRLGSSETAGQTKVITPEKDGTFSAEFSFSDHIETYGRLSLLDGENVMDSKYIQIKDYVKPTYVFDVDLPGYAVMPHIDPVEGSVTASYFEGTPAEKLSFEINGAKSTPKNIITDKNGYADFSLTYEDTCRWQPYNKYTTVTLSGIENEYSYSDKSITAFYRDVMFSHDYDRDTRSLTIETNSIDFDKIPEYLENSRYNYDILKGKAYDTEVQIKITHYWTEKVETGSHYDFLEKKNVTDYEYVSRDEVIGTYTVDTVNGKGVLEKLPLDDERGCYEFDISYKDSLGQEVTDGFDIYGKKYVSWWEMQSSYLIYTLVPYPEDENRDINFRENEAIPFKLECNGGPVEQGKVFLAAYKNDLIDEKVYTSTEFSYKTDLDNIPSFRYDGAYFDGRHVYPISGSLIAFNPEERNITLDISTDKETYDAGDTVKLTVTAKNTDGSLVNGAAVSLSVVDEAAFAVREQYVDTLSDIYEETWYDYASLYYSYIQHVLDASGGGEKGGGDFENSVRKDFKDTAYFGSQLTGADGKTVFTFKLADNLTTWRATVQAVKEYETGRVHSGSTKAPVIATRPLFITPIMLSSYLAGDDVAVSAKCHGIDPTDKINITIKGTDTEKTLEALSAQTVNFGKLPEGEYTVLFKAEKNGNSDAVEMPLTVTDTLLETSVTNSFDLSEGMNIKPLRWPVTLTFFDKEYMFCTDILRELVVYHGDRLDMRAASNYALMEFGYISEESFSNSVATETYEGFARLLPTTETDPELTALLCAALPECVTKSSVTAAFDDLVSMREADSEDISIGYMGLAALGEPVLEEVKTLLKEHSSEFDYYEKMRLTAALALCGDFENAYSYYLEYCPEIILDDRNPENVMAYIKSENETQIQEKTKLALITASILNLREAEYFARYLISKDPVYDSYALELVIYLRNYVPDIEGEAVFTYNLDGKTETVTLDRHRGYTLRFGEEQFRNADFKVISGAVYTVASYEARISEMSNEPTINVTKTLSGDFTPGGKVTVRITASTHDGRTPTYFTIEDVIPSCGRYLEDWQDNCYNRSGQRVSLWTDKFGRASYSFRIATSGDYVVEGAAALQDGEWGISDRSTITVKGDNDAV